MTALFSAMLIASLVCAIIVIARYYGSSSLAGNLLMTLAFSIAVGLGVRAYTNYNDVDSKNVKIEKATVTNNLTSMPLVSILQIDTVGFKVSGKKEVNYVAVDDSLKEIQQLNPIINLLGDLHGIPIFVDSS